MKLERRLHEQAKFYGDRSGLAAFDIAYKQSSTKLDQQNAKTAEILKEKDRLHRHLESCGITTGSELEIEDRGPIVLGIFNKRTGQYSLRNPPGQNRRGPGNISAYYLYKQLTERNIIPKCNDKCTHG